VCTSPLESQACAALARPRSEYEEAMHADWAATGVAKIETRSLTALLEANN